jgi:type II secretory pathway predicted ATPase ExeA
LTDYLHNWATRWCARCLHHLVTASGATPRFHRPALIAHTADLLAAERDERRTHVILIVDEARLLSRSARACCSPTPT